ncbi:hypothetical protein SRM_01949 [Salinibacter ruber M8]|uniref:Uncharacterized protein n=1 Tax=Salinibacter ruber (strain M8) TaxID=761659 RepID=D5HA15_SALRM|nr:hypothetical protein SRM_01949 [Salinibacter ruber M8]
MPCRKEKLFIGQSIDLQNKRFTMTTTNPDRLHAWS